MLLLHRVLERWHLTGGSSNINVAGQHSWALNPSMSQAAGQPRVWGLGRAAVAPTADGDASSAGGCKRCRAIVRVAINSRRCWRLQPPALLCGVCSMGRGRANRGWDGAELSTQVQRNPRLQQPLPVIAALNVHIRAVQIRGLFASCSSAACTCLASWASAASPAAAALHSAAHLAQPAAPAAACPGARGQVVRSTDRRSAGCSHGWLMANQRVEQQEQQHQLAQQAGMLML
jgi:hypothetical protein